MWMCKSRHSCFLSEHSQFSQPLGFSPLLMEPLGCIGRALHRRVLGIRLSSQIVACSGSGVEQLHIVGSLVLAKNFLSPYRIRVINQVLPLKFQVPVLWFGYFKNSELAEEQNTKEKRYAFCCECHISSHHHCLEMYGFQVL